MPQASNEGQKNQIYILWEILWCFFFFLFFFLRESSKLDKKYVSE